MRHYINLIGCYQWRYIIKFMIQPFRNPIYFLILILTITKYTSETLHQSSQMIQYSNITEIKQNLSVEQQQQDQKSSYFLTHRLLSCPNQDSHFPCPSTFSNTLQCHIDDSDCTVQICKCLPGFYKNNSFQCLPCPALPYCLECKKDKGVISCQKCTNQSYRIDGQCYKCNQINIGCDTCHRDDGQFTCDACFPTFNRYKYDSDDNLYKCICSSGFYPSTVSFPPTCVLCPTGCVTCTFATTIKCTACIATGFFPSGSTCIACMPVCLTCLNANACTKCIATNVNTTSAICVCQNGKLYDPIQQNCLACSSIISNCATCSYAGGSYVAASPTNVICTAAAPGYYVVMPGQTSTLPCIPNCAICSDNTTCTTCSSGFAGSGTTSCYCDSGAATPVFLLSNNTCGICSLAIANCTTCFLDVSTTKCTLCDGSFYLATPVLSLSCAPCMQYCAICSDGTTCTNCSSNLTQILTPTYHCGCDSGLLQYLILNPLSCVSCSALYLKCTACTPSASSIICTACQAGYYPSVDGLQCLQCMSICATCSAPNICDTCLNGNTLDLVNCPCTGLCADCMSNSSNSCVACSTSVPLNCTTCNAGYFPDPNPTNAGKCTACINSKCDTCDQTGGLLCLTCDIPYVIDVYGNCICNSTSLSYMDSGGACTSCNLVYNQCTSCSVDASGTTLCNSCSNIAFFISNTVNCGLCDTATAKCYSCSINATNCLSCQPTYALMSPGVCACNTTADMVYDSSTGGCRIFTIVYPNCLIFNLTSQVCMTCNDPYFWNSTSSQCELCPDSCLSCSSPTVCLVCKPTFVMSNTLTSYIDPNLCVCDNQTIPLVFLNVITNTCVDCASLISNCQTCTFNGVSYVCSIPNPGTYVNIGGTVTVCDPVCATCDATGCLTCPIGSPINNTCICSSNCSVCQSLSSGCINCLINSSGSLTSCSICLSGYYLTSPTCTACPSGCATCTDSVTCQSCKQTYTLSGIDCVCANNAGYFYYQPDGSCKICQNIIPGCSVCSFDGFTTVCSVCDSGYYLTGTSSCLPCAITCLQCLGLSTTCTSCLPGYTLGSGTCTPPAVGSCSFWSSCASCTYDINNSPVSCDTCLAGMYFSTASICTTCNSPCATCVDYTLNTCNTCLATFILLNSQCVCDSSTYMYLVSGSCVSCKIAFPNCNSCVVNMNVLSCTSCQYLFYLNGTTCVRSVCGDGNITSGQICDAGTLNGVNGCSLTCTMNPGYECTGNPSVCIFTSKFDMYHTKTEVIKDSCNKVQLTFSMQPYYLSYQTGKYTQFFQQVNSSLLLSHTTSYIGNGKIKFTFLFNGNIEGQSFQFFFAPKFTAIPEITLLSVYIVNLKIKSINNFPALYVDPQSCASKKKIQSIAATAEYTSYITMALSMVPCKIVGLELMGVMQLAHLTVGNIDAVNVMLSPFMSMKGVNGLALKLDQKQQNSRLLQSLTPDRINGIGYKSNFLRNCNLMLMIVCAVISISFILYMTSFMFNNCAPTLYSFSRRFAKQVMLTLILFNCFNFAYSAGLHFNYAQSSDPLYMLGTLAAVAVIIIPLLMAIALVCTQDEGFGQYKDKFKPGKLQRLYFVFTIIYRQAIGLYTSTSNESNLSTLIVLAVSVAFVVYNLVNLPFTKAYHNYRANICHITQFVCLFVAMYYRSMKANDSYMQTAKIYTPAYIEISCILISVVVSLIVLVYQVYLFIKQCFCKKQSKVETGSDKNEEHDVRRSTQNVQLFQVSHQNFDDQKVQKPKTIQKTYHIQKQISKQDLGQEYV